MPFEVISQDCKLRCAIIEASLSLFVTCHSAFLPIDHLSELTKKCFKDDSAASKLKLHRTKCTSVVKNLLYPYFKENLRMDIGDNMFSLLVDESTDISVKKQLGICIIFFSETRQSVVSTFLNILEIDNGTTASVVDGIKKNLVNI